MRRSTLSLVAAVASFLLVVGGCSGDDDGGGGDSTTTTTEATTEGETTTAPEAEDADVDCAAYTTVIELFAGSEQIATGSDEVQVAADESLDTALAALAPAAEGDQFVTEAIDTLGEVSFQVTDDAAEGPSSDEIDVALATIEDAWSGSCAETTPPADTTVPVEGEGEGATENPECPSPEVLEAEGFACDSEGNLTPLDEETVTECPAPEVLEAEGFTCDSEGNLTPIEPEGDAAEGGQVEECPAPEVLEAEGYECDSEGNLTPIDE
jgi:hypothetical protein